LITGADGVMVPMVTQQQKHKRRATQAKKRKGEARKSTASVGRPRTGSDGPYKEFKIVSFYDPDKAHLYAVGTSGDHRTPTKHQPPTLPALPAKDRPKHAVHLIQRGRSGFAKGQSSTLVRCCFCAQIIMKTSSQRPRSFHAPDRALL